MNQCKLAFALFVSAFCVSAGVAASWWTDNEVALAALREKAAHLKLPFADWQALGQKQFVTHALNGSQSKEMAGFGAMVADAAPQDFIEAFRSLAVFKNSATTLACGRFSATPQLHDLDGLNLSDKDLYALLRAQSHAADIKLTESDLTRLRAVTGPAPIFVPKTKAKLATEYKAILLEKAQTFVAQGGEALGAYADQPEPVNGFAALRNMWRFHATTAGRDQAFAEQFISPTNESFLYWALQKFGSLRPVISLVNVVIRREGDRVYIVSQQLYASHYTEAGLGIAELIPTSDGTQTLTAYTVRLQVDLLGGSMGFMKKRMAQPHMLETIKTSLQGLRTTVETQRLSQLAK